MLVSEFFTGPASDPDQEREFINLDTLRRVDKPNPLRASTFSGSIGGCATLIHLQIALSDLRNCQKVLQSGVKYQEKHSVKIININEINGLLCLAQFLLICKTSEAQWIYSGFVSFN